MGSKDIDIWAERIWEYHQLHHPLAKVDCIFVLGSNDIRVAEYAAQLYKDGYAPLLVCSGGIAHKRDLLNTTWQEPEGEVFAKRVMELGVPEDRIIVENQAMNTGENVTFTESILQEKGLDLQSFIVVQKPFMERRAFATIKQLWPDKEIIVTSPPISFKDYPNDTISKDQLINILVGDLQRIKVYPSKGFQIPQDIPADVWEAFENLVAKGYDKHLLLDVDLDLH